MLEHTRKLFKVLADNTRLRMLMLLKKRKICVCEFASILGISQPGISRHLKKMKEAGLIGYEQDGLWTNYCLKNNRMTKDVLVLLRRLVKDGRTLTADRQQLKRSDRRKLCCRNSSE